MKKCSRLLLCCALVLANSAHAQTNMRVRGTITAFDGTVLSVKSRDGRDLRLQLADNATVAAAQAVAFGDIKRGDYVGSAAMKHADGSMVALEVHYIARTVPEGHIPWDLEPGSTMTNAAVAAMVQSAGRRELTLEYKGGSQKILVPEGTPIVRTVPADRSYLVPGSYVFVIARTAADGGLTALRVQVGKDGIKPPQ